MDNLHMLSGRRGSRGLPNAGGGGLRRIIKEPEGTGVPRIRGQSCDEPPGGRLGKTLDRLQIGGALEGGGERVVRRGVYHVWHVHLVFRRQHPKGCTTNLRRGGAALGEPAGPEGTDAAGTTGIECRRRVVGTEGPARVGGDERHSLRSQRMAPSTRPMMEPRVRGGWAQRGSARSGVFTCQSTM